MAYIRVFHFLHITAPLQTIIHFLRLRTPIVNYIGMHCVKMVQPATYGDTSLTMIARRGSIKVYGPLVRSVLVYRHELILLSYIGNAWAALGMLRVSVTISKSSHAPAMAYAVNNLNMWIKEILDNTFAALVRVYTPPI